MMTGLRILVIFASLILIAMGSSPPNLAMLGLGIFLMALYFFLIYEDFTR